MQVAVLVLVHTGPESNPPHAASHSADDKSISLRVWDGVRQWLGRVGKVFGEQSSFMRVSPVGSVQNNGIKRQPNTNHPALGWVHGNGEKAGPNEGRKKEVLYEPVSSPVMAWICAVFRSLGMFCSCAK